MAPPRLRICLAAATLLLVAALFGRAGAGDDLVASLGAGETAFWHGPFIKRATDFQEGDSCEGRKCFVYRIEVAERAARLRVAIDYPMGDDHFELRLRDPRGKRVKAQPSGLYSSEIFVQTPRIGTWTIEVLPRFVTKTAFRLRAKLESAAQKPTGRRLLAPNLRLEPPFGFTFRPPVTMAAGVTVDAGRSEARGSCGFDESLEDSARHCLRFSVGPQNAGAGPLELRFSPVTDAATGEAPMYQRLHYSDGSTRERRAGAYEYHKAHGHYHFTGFASLELFRVTNRADGSLEPAGAGHKSGFCFSDVMMNSWRRFIQDAAGSSRSSCGDLIEAYMGLSTGWTDIYDSATPGNYVEFGDNPDGFYVVRATVDARDVILETKEQDNVSYAYIRVRHNEIRLLERGYGSSPWDPNKIAVVDWVKVLARRG